MPAGTTAGIVVFDRRSNTFAERLNADAPSGRHRWSSCSSPSTICGTAARPSV
ncbi:hypothetical protein ACFQ2B_12090 [Streptomyces stramineus]